MIGGKQAITIDMAVAARGSIDPAFLAFTVILQSWFLIIAQHPNLYSFETLSVVLFGNRPLQNDGPVQVREGCGGCRWSSSSITERELQVAFLVRARGMILFEFYLVLENVFAVSTCKFNEQKRPAQVFGD